MERYTDILEITTQSSLSRLTKTSFLRLVKALRRVEIDRECWVDFFCCVGYGHFLFEGDECKGFKFYNKGVARVWSKQGESNVIDSIKILN